MTDSLWITAAYFFTIILSLSNFYVKKMSFTLFNGFFAAWVFILGGTHELVYGETSLAVFIGGVCVCGGVFLNHCYLKLHRLRQEYKAMEETLRVSKEDRDKKLRKLFWDVRN